VENISAQEIQLELGALKLDLRLRRPPVEGGGIAFKNTHFNERRRAGGLTLDQLRRSGREIVVRPL